MDGFVPDEVMRLIEAIEAKRGIEYHERKRREEAQIARRAELERLRAEKREELRAATKTITDWIDRFNGTIAPSVFGLLGKNASIVLYAARFRDLWPAPKDDVTVSATLRLGAPDSGIRNHLVYEERFKGQSVYRQPLMGPHFIDTTLHPEFVLGCASHLAGPDAWKHVRAELERLAKP